MARFDSKFPKKRGWYWARYGVYGQHKYPAYCNGYEARFADGERFNKDDKKRNKEWHLEFGPEIKEPK